jgi:hypothetical protein
MSRLFTYNSRKSDYGGIEKTDENVYNWNDTREHRQNERRICAGSWS